MKYSRDLKLAELRSGGTGTTRYKNAIAAGIKYPQKLLSLKGLCLQARLITFLRLNIAKHLLNLPAGQDYEFVYDDTGKFQNVKLVNIEGGKQEEEASKEDQARIAGFTNQSRSGRIVLKIIDRAIEIAMGTNGYRS